MERLFGFARILGSGAPAPLATIHVYNAGTLSHAPLYQDNVSPPTPLANPIFADSNGFYFFYTPNALVDLQFSGGGIVTPYAIPSIPAGGIGDGGLLPVSSSSAFPAVSSQHRGRMRLLGDSTLGPPGVWVQDIAAWQPALDYAFRSYARAALPAGSPAGQIRRVSDGPQGLFVSTGAAGGAGWEPALSAAFDSVAKAALPTPGLPGRLRRVTDGVRGLWMDQNAQWISLSREWIDVREFGAAGDGAADDTAAIQAALNAVPAAGGVVGFPPGRTYKVSAPLLVKDKTTIIGWGATISSTGGDCLIRGARRDDNVLANIDRIRVFGLSITTGLITPFAVFDLTGLSNSLIEGVRISGTPDIAGQSGFRLADSNPAKTSSKSCNGNTISGVFVENLYTFALIIQGNSDRVFSNTFFQGRGEGLDQGFNVIGITPAGSRLTMVCVGVALFSGGGAPSTGTLQAVTAPAPPGLTFIGCYGQDFADGNGALVAPDHFQTDFGIGASGTSNVNPVSPGGIIPEAFGGSVYLRILAGTVIPAGASTYNYTFALSLVPTGLAKTFLVAFVSGLPGGSPLSCQVTFSGQLATLTVVSGIALTLASDLVMRVIQVAP